MELDQLCDKLIKSGHRLTSQRVAVISVLRLAKRQALSAEQVYAQARQVERGIGQTTVYRTLTLLTELQCVQKAWGDQGTASYRLTEAAAEGGARLICQRCGTAIPLSLGSAAGLQADFERLGMEITPDQELQLCVCARCKRKEDENADFCSGRHDYRAGGRNLDPTNASHTER